MHKSLALAAFLSFATPVLAAPASMDVAPTNIDLAPGAGGLFYITNHGSQAIHVQVQGMDWSQDNGADALTPSRVLFVSPPAAEIAPGGRQTVRLMASPAATGESAYRLLVTQLPDSGPADPHSVAVLLQFSVPVFVGAHRREAPDLAWDSVEKDGEVSLTVRNNGAFAAKCVNVSLRQDGKTVPFDPGAVFYVLPHGVRQFRVGHVEGRGLLHLSGHDQRSDSDFAADVALHP